MDALGSLSERDEAFQGLEYSRAHGACQHVDEADRLHEHLPVGEQLFVAATNAFYGIHKDVMSLANFVGEDGNLGCLQETLELRLILLTLQDHARKLRGSVKNLLLLAFEDAKNRCHQWINLGAGTTVVTT